MCEFYKLPLMDLMRRSKAVTKIMWGTVSPQTIAKPNHSKVPDDASDEDRDTRIPTTTMKPMIDGTPRRKIDPNVCSETKP